MVECFFYERILTGNDKLFLCDIINRCIDKLDGT